MSNRNQNAAQSEAQARDAQLAEQQAKQQADADAAKAKANDGADQAAKEAADRDKADAEAKAKAEEAHAEREERDAKLLARLEKLEKETAEKNDEIAELKSRLDAPKKTGPIAKLVCKSFNAEQSAKQLREIRSVSDPRRQMILSMPAPKGKTFLVTPVGRNAGDMGQAIVSNCADEADAKAEYFKNTNAVAHKVSLKVEPYGETKAEYETRAREIEAADQQSAAEFAEFQAMKRMQMRRA